MADNNSKQQTPTNTHTAVAKTMFWQAFDDMIEQVTADMARNGTDRPSITQEVVRPLLEKFKGLPVESKGTTKSGTQITAATKSGNYLTNLVAERKKTAGGNKPVMDAIRDAMKESMKSTNRRSGGSGNVE